MKERTNPQPCEAPQHHEKCPCQSCELNTPEACRNCKHITNDHFTPRSVAAYLGWSNKQLHHSENRQWLSKPCHRDKDRDTPVRKEVIKQQNNGANFDLRAHLTTFLGEDTVEALETHTGQSEASEKRVLTDTQEDAYCLLQLLIQDEHATLGEQYDYPAPYAVFEKEQGGYQVFTTAENKPSKLLADIEIEGGEGND